MDSENRSEKQFMTVEEFANRIGVHPQTVRTWDRQGILLPHHKTPSGRRLYTEEQVKEYFEGNNKREG